MYTGIHCFPQNGSDICQHTTDWVSSKDWWHQRTGGSSDVEEQVYWEYLERENRKLLQGPGYGHVGWLGSSEVGGPRMEAVGKDEVWRLCGLCKLDFRQQKRQQDLEWRGSLKFKCQSFNLGGNQEAVRRWWLGRVHSEAVGCPKHEQNFF